MDAVNQRLGQFIAYKKIRKIDFAVSIGRYKQQIDSWLNAGVKIPVVCLSEICNSYPDLNALWLLTGKESMIVKSATQETLGFFEDQLTVWEQKNGKFCPFCADKQKRVDRYIDELLILKNKYIRLLEKTGNTK